MKKILKVYRYYCIYGLLRTISKIAGRNRSFILIRPLFLWHERFIGLVGSGQFQFSTIAFYLTRGFVNRLLFSQDLEIRNAQSLADYYNIPFVFNKIEDSEFLDNLRLVYIASNHSTHSYYSTYFLNKNIDVYCEKPIAVSFDQFDSLLKSIRSSEANFFVGYNRPYSKAVQFIKNLVKEKQSKDQKFSMNCFISAHDIPADHWYRNDEEGTRICGNLGHWIDLMVHVYNWRGYIPPKYTIQITYSNFNEPDDNICVNITTTEGDLFSVMITARSEPFEGINETINIQYSTLIVKIDDFRRLTVWDNEKVINRRYSPKDVGHKRAIKQPFLNDNRDFVEIVSSTEIMLTITDMVRSREFSRDIELNYKL